MAKKNEANIQYRASEITQFLVSIEPDQNFVMGFAYAMDLGSENDDGEFLLSRDQAEEIVKSFFNFCTERALERMR